MLSISALCDLASVRRPSETASNIRVYMNVEPSLKQTLARVTLSVYASRIEAIC